MESENKFSWTNFISINKYKIQNNRYIPKRIKLPLGQEKQYHLISKEFIEGDQIETAVIIIEDNERYEKQIAMKDYNEVDKMSSEDFFYQILNGEKEIKLLERNADAKNIERSSKLSALFEIK